MRPLYIRTCMEFSANPPDKSANTPAPYSRFEIWTLRTLNRRARAAFGLPPAFGEFRPTFSMSLCLCARAHVFASAQIQCEEFYELELCSIFLLFKLRHRCREILFYILGKGKLEPPRISGALTQKELRRFGEKGFDARENPSLCSQNVT